MKLYSLVVLNSLFALSGLSQNVLAKPLYQTEINVDFPNQTLPVGISRDEQSLALSALDQLRAKLPISENSQFQQVAVKESLSAKHFHFVQQINGTPIANTALTITIGTKASHVLRTYQHIVPTKDLHVPSQNISISEKQAIRLAYENLKPTGELLALPEALLVYLPTQKGLLLSYEVKISLTAPQGGWLQYVDATTGKILSLAQRELHQKLQQQSTLGSDQLPPDHFQQTSTKKMVDFEASMQAFQSKSAQLSRSNTSYVQGKGKVFLTNPQVELNSTHVRYDSPEYMFDSAYTEVVLPEITLSHTNTGKEEYHLTGPWVHIAELQKPLAKPTTSTNGEWLYTRDQQAFWDVNAFYAIDQNQRYLQSLGYVGRKGIQYRSIPVDTNGLDGENNSRYTTHRTIVLGGRDIMHAEDSDIILHEYGHAIVDDIVGNTDGGDWGAMNEGFADYWAMSTRKAPKHIDDYFINRIATWGESRTLEGYLRIMDHDSARYDPTKTYAAHKRLGSYKMGTDQLWSTPLYQSMLEIQSNGDPKEDVDKIILNSMYGLSNSATMPIWAKSIVKTAKADYPNKSYADIFEKHFIKHNILNKKLDIIHVEQSEVLLPGHSAWFRPVLFNDSVNPLKNILAAVTQAPGLTVQQAQLQQSTLLTEKTSQFSDKIQVQVPSNADCTSPVDILFEAEGEYPDADILRGDKKVTRQIGYPNESYWINLANQPLSPIGDTISSIEISGTTPQKANRLKLWIDIEGHQSDSVEIRLQHSDYVVPLLISRTKTDKNGHFQATIPNVTEQNDGLSYFKNFPLDGTWSLFIRPSSTGKAGKLRKWGLISDDHTFSCKPQPRQIKKVIIGEGESHTIPTLFAQDPANTAQWQQRTTSSPSLRLTQANGTDFRIEAPVVNQTQTILTDITLSNGPQEINRIQVPVEVRNTQASFQLKPIPAQWVMQHMTLSLYASSVTPSKQPLTYKWEVLKNAGLKIDLKNADRANVSFDAPSVSKSTKVVLQVIARDGPEHSKPLHVEVTITKDNGLFIAPMKTTETQSGETVEIVAHAHAADRQNAHVSYDWAPVNPILAHQITIQKDQNTMSFIAPEVDRETTLIFAVTAIDSFYQNKEYAYVLVKPKKKPVIHPFPDSGFEAFSGQQVRIPANAEAFNGQPIQYQWKVLPLIRFEAGLIDGQETNSDIQFEAPDVSEETSLVFELTVSDGISTSESVPVMVRVKPYQAPTLNPFNAVTVQAGQLIQLTASGKSMIKSALTYEWEQMNSTGVDLMSGMKTGQTMSVSAPMVTKSTTMRLRVIAKDRKGQSQPQFVQITIHPRPVSPVTDDEEDPSSPVSPVSDDETETGPGTDTTRDSGTPSTENNDEAGNEPASTSATSDSGGAIFLLFAFGLFGWRRRV